MSDEMIERVRRFVEVRKRVASPSAADEQQLIADLEAMIAAIEATTVKGDGLDASARTMTVPTYDQCDTYVAGQYMFNYLRTFLAMAGIDASTCRLVIELPDRDTQRQLVSAVQRDSKGPPRSAGKIGNHSGVWQGVEYEFSVKGWNAKSRAFGYEATHEAADTITTLKGEIERLKGALERTATVMHKMICCLGGKNVRDGGTHYRWATMLSVEDGQEAMKANNANAEMLTALSQGTDR